VADGVTTIDLKAGAAGRACRRWRARRWLPSPWRRKQARAEDPAARCAAVKLRAAGHKTQGRPLQTAFPGTADRTLPSPTVSIPSPFGRDRS
jgi:hypothetical protein